MMDRPTAYTDPSGLFGSIGTAVGALLALLVAFGVQLTEVQVTAILGVVAAVGPLLTAWAIRRHAWAPKSVEQARVDAHNAGWREALEPDPELGPATAYERDADGNPVQVHPGTYDPTESDA